MYRSSPWHTWRPGTCRSDPGGQSREQGFAGRVLVLSDADFEPGKVNFRFDDRRLT